MRLSYVFGLKKFFYKNPENIIINFNLIPFNKVDVFKDGSCKTLITFNEKYDDIAGNISVKLIGNENYVNFEKNRKAFYFDGNSYFEIDAALTNLPMTISLWVKTTQRVVGVYGWANPVFIGVATVNLYDFGIENNDGYLHIFSGFYGEDYFKTNKFIADNNWHHIVVDFSINGEKIYCDNTLISIRNKDNVTLSNTNIENCSGKWYIGNMIRNCNGFVEKSILNQTSIANLRIFNKDLSKKEIEFLYKNKI